MVTDFKNQGCRSFTVPHHQHSSSISRKSYCKWSNPQPKGQSSHVHSLHAGARTHLQPLVHQQAFHYLNRKTQHHAAIFAFVRWETQQSNKLCMDKNIPKQWHSENHIQIHIVKAMTINFMRAQQGFLHCTLGYKMTYHWLLPPNHHYQPNTGSANKHIIVKRN